jgi:hypothetical protein
MLTFVLLLLAATFVIVVSIVGVLAASQPRDFTGRLPLPNWLEAFMRRDGVAYRAHAVLGRTLNTLRGPPVAAGVQWLKAVAHARSDAEIAEAAHGIALARARGGDSQGLETVLCAALDDERRGRQLAAMVRAGLSCAPEAELWGAVPDDTPISYPTRPPTAGFYRDTVYQGTALARYAVPAPVWIHNLAHGQVALLYNCPLACPEIVAKSQALLEELRRDLGDRAPNTRLVVISYTDMEYPIAVVAWGVLLELERFDHDRIAAFYWWYVDQGVECKALTCPE